MAPKRKTTPSRKKLSPKIKVKRRLYSTEQMENAVKAVKDGMSYGEASKKFNVPRITLLYKSQGKCKKSTTGPDSVFTKDEEKLLIKWILQMGKAGFPITKDELLDSVCRLVKDLKKKEPERKFPFTNDRPGRHWFESFQKRNPEIAIRTPQNLTTSRASVTEAKLRTWHKEVTDYLEKTNCMDIMQDPNRIFNCDEAAFFLNPKGNKVLASRGEKSVYSIVSCNEKENLTVMMNTNAKGDVVSPMIMFQYERVPQDIADSIPKGWGIGTSDNGWMTNAAFYTYIANVFHPWLLRNSIQLPVILFLDGHISHLSFHVSQFCRENGIILVALYPNSTHIIQPMDVAVFKTLKSSWKKEVYSWRLQESNLGKDLKKRNFAPLLDSAITKSVLPATVKNGFRKCGICPWDVNAINFKLIPKDTKSDSQTEAQSSTSHSYNPSFISALNVMEQEIGLTKLKNFQEQLNDVKWREHLDITDHGLFELWRKIKLKTNGQPDIETEVLFDGFLPVLSDGAVYDLSEFETSTIDFESILIDPHTNDIQSTLDQNNKDFQSTFDPNAKDIQPTLDPNNKDIQPTLDPNAKDIQPTLDPNNKDIQPTLDPNNKDIQPTLDPNNKDIQPTLDSNSKDIQPTLDANSKNIQPTLDPNAKDIQPTLDPNNKDIQPTLDPNNKVIQPTLDPNNKVIQPTIDPNNKDIQPTLDSNSKDIQPILRDLNSKVQLTSKQQSDIPSPFKNSLPWPEDIKTKKKTRYKEKIPTVVTSDEYQAYYRKKQEKKQEEERLKLERMEKRKTKGEKTLQKKKKKKVVEIESDPDDPQDFTLNDSYVLNSYVIVKYEGEYFPGLIEEIDSKNEFKISTMSMSGSGWKWPENKDTCWYRKEDLVEKIQSPDPINNRGTFSVPEIIKWQKIT